MSYSFNWLNKKAKTVSYSKSERSPRCYILIHAFILWIFTAVFPILTQNYINKLQNRQKRTLFEKLRFSHLVRKVLSCCGKRIFFPTYTAVQWWTPLYKTPSSSKVVEILRNVHLSNVNCHPQATCVCCTHRAGLQAGSFGRNPKPRHAMVSGNQNSVAQNVSVTENVTTNGFVVRIKLLRTC